MSTIAQINNHPWLSFYVVLAVLSGLCYAADEWQHYTGSNRVRNALAAFFYPALVCGGIMLSFYWLNKLL